MYHLHHGCDGVETICNEQELLTSYIPMLSYEFNGIENLARSLALAKLHTTCDCAPAHDLTPKYVTLSQTRCIIEEKRKKRKKKDTKRIEDTSAYQISRRIGRPRNRENPVCFAFPDYQITSQWSANANDTQFRLLRIAWEGEREGGERERERERERVKRN